MDIANGFKPTVTKEQMIASAPRYTTSVGGILTEQYGPIDSSYADVDVTGSTVGGLTSGAASGAALGSVIPGLGTVAGGVIGGVIGGIGGLFGAKSKKKKIEEEMRKAERQRINLNNANILNSQTKSLRMREAEEFGDQENQSLFHKWASGKEPDVNPETGETYKNYIVNTSKGKKYMPQNAWVSKGEIIRSRDGSMYLVKSGKNDTARAYIQPGDTIYSNKIINPETGNKIADDVKLYDKLGILSRLNMNLKLGRSNKLMKFKFGMEELIPTVAGLVGAYRQYKEASKPLYVPNISSQNQYLGVIPNMISLRQDYYPIWLQNREIEARGKNAIRSSGGLSAGQKALAYASMYNNTQQNNAKALFDTQLANNQLKAKAYEAALTTGKYEADRLLNANAFNAEMLSKAHNAALQGRQMSMYNSINALLNFFANRFKKNQFDRTLALYQLELDERAKDRDTMYGNNKKSNTSPVGLYSLPLFSKQARSLLSRQLYPSILPTLDEINSINYGIRR